MCSFVLASKYFQLVIFLTIVHCVSLQITFVRKTPLVVGIFSAPQNFERRDSLRKTWLKLTRDGSAKYFFVVGKSMCPIHPHDRRDLIGCTERRIYPSSEPIASWPNAINKHLLHPADGFAFTADYTIEITHISLHSCYHRFIGPIQIQLKDGYDGRVLAEVSFTTDDPATKKISPVTFPRYSEGLLITNGVQNRKCYCPVLTESTQGGVTITKLLKNGRIQTWDGGTSICSHFVYKILEAETASNVSRRLLAWRKSIETVNYELTQERRKFNDIFLVNITDVYKNLPSKLIEFISSLTDFDYLLKTDDDSFIDVRRVLAELSNPSIPTKSMWWWSFFKEYWHVPHHGKWREDQYMSASYPPFPCGGGYVINRVTAQYLSDNKQHLKLFQGEDVSIGIWLSAVDIKRHNNDQEPAASQPVSYKIVMLGKCEARCVWTCDDIHPSQPFCNLVQMSIPEMYSKWRDFEPSGFL